MEGIQTHIDIMKYWEGVERFTPQKLDGKSITFVQYQHKIPWRSLDNGNSLSGENHIYTIFLGIISFANIATLVAQMLQDSTSYQNNSELSDKSFLCTFQVDNNGKILSDTFAVPEYFLSIACLDQKNAYAKEWIDFIPVTRQKLQDAFQSWTQQIKTRTNPTVSLADLQELLSDIVTASGMETITNSLSNQIAILQGTIPASASRFSSSPHEAYDNTEVGTMENSDLSILRSFYLDDIRMVSNAMIREDVGAGLMNYLRSDYIGVRHDLRNDLSAVQRLSAPSMLSPARWPSSNSTALSLAQHVAVNIAVNTAVRDTDGLFSINGAQWAAKSTSQAEITDAPGLFSINGPPGTGKSTLLRDIISNVVTARAQLLAELPKPQDAFISSQTIEVDRYKYKVWTLQPQFLRHQIVIASSNNSAVENISKEIPRSSEVDSTYGLQYFADIATQINGEKSWGIGAAVLGNKNNCSTFFEKLLMKGDIERIGLESFLQGINTHSTWLEVTNNFKDALKEFSVLKDELQHFANQVEQVDMLRAQHKELKESVNGISKRLEEYNEKMRTAQDTLLQNQIAIEETIAKLRTPRPLWYVLVCDIFKEYTKYQEWSDTRLADMWHIGRLLKSNRKLKEKLLEMHREAFKFTFKLRPLVAALSDVTEQLNHSSKEVEVIKNKYEWYSPIPTQEFWGGQDNDIQLSSPWLHKQLETVRSKVFVEAMNLHYSFILHTKQEILNNIRSIRQALTGESTRQFKLFMKDLWSTFFMLVPSVSTTFASFSRLFSGLEERESIGWLLIDEAGQSAPQEALGAIYRSRRTIVVGDPLQIPPVVGISSTINDLLLEYYNINSEWSVLEQSVQTISDRANMYGTYVGDIWVGCPLRVHRRCIDPMFTLANQIAYDNLMIQGTSSISPAIVDVYPKTQWLDVRDQDFDGHWSRKEGMEALQIINGLIQRTGTLPDLYIISPFKSVAEKMRKLLRNSIRAPEGMLQTMLTEWVKKSVGTVHKFQGKQAQAVILLLGGNPSNTGAINWASRHPNILNVALTRAKYRFIVVGNHSIWSTRSYFSLLPTMIPIIEATN
ncbi:AAA domain-containing protein [Rickettsiales endosymbiont of Peranema trichophorum]|uniref:AAA domain-containing protein n=1 Tax=Rickettsiales endosymbiont of Peranema trichophorum TaxID=2486577 RepID=UPI001A92EC5D|nr:AAA domain-containing protein [Rickettsiales endosymbiont of Peranema trichophorum]